MRPSSVISKISEMSGVAIFRLSFRSVARSGVRSNESASWLPSNTGALPIASSCGSAAPFALMIDEIST